VDGRDKDNNDMMDETVGARRCHGQQQRAIDDTAPLQAVAPIINTMEAMSLDEAPSSSP
jgi:hypothetical protein